MDKALIEKINKKLEYADSITVLDYFFTNYPKKIAFASSFGVEDQVITHIIHMLNKPVKIFTLDTGRLFPETYDLIDKTRNRYNADIEIYFPQAKAVEAMVNSKGVNLFYESVENRKLCCNIRKIEPLQRALADQEAWISGLRREQSPTRLNMQLAEWDDFNKLLKVNPLINWTEQEVWDYVKAHNIPYNVLHDKGFLSIGCQPCTRAVAKDEDVRAGRWWWENPDTKECGLHKR